MDKISGFVKSFTKISHKNSHSALSKNRSIGSVKSSIYKMEINPENSRQNVRDYEA